MGPQSRRSLKSTGGWGNFMKPTISIKQALSFAFSTLTTRYGLLFILVIASFVVPVAAFLVPLFTMALPLGIVGKVLQPTIPPQAFQTWFVSPASIIMLLVAFCIGLFIYMWAMITITDVLLHVHQGVRWSRAQLHHLRTLISPAIGSIIIYNICKVTLLILLIIPGIIWILSCGFYWYALVDEHQGAVESLKESARLTRGNRLKLLSFYLLFLLCAVILGVILRHGPWSTVTTPSRMLDIMSSLISGIIQGIMALAEIDIYYQLKNMYAVKKV